jgi:thiamine-phosphate pyrophosphorylase
MPAQGAADPPAAARLPVFLRHGEDAMVPRFDLSLYLVTDPVLVGPRGVAAVVEAAVEGGVTIVQLRDKTSPDDVFAREAEHLLRILKPRGIPFIVNDRVDVALAVGVDGVHVGQSDEDPRRVREKIGPDRILGLSVGTQAELDAVPRDLVDYLGIGPVAATATKPDHDPPIGIAGAAALAVQTMLPTVAIGGIGVANTPALIDAGLGGVAVVSAICAAPDPRAAARSLAAAIAAARSRLPERTR